jgi:hypothetical protein
MIKNFRDKLNIVTDILWAIYLPTISFVCIVALFEHFFG